MAGGRTPPCEHRTIVRPTDPMDRHMQVVVPRASPTRRHSLALVSLLGLASAIASAEEYQVQVLPWEQLSKRFDVDATPVAVSMTLATGSRLQYGCINVVFTVRGNGKVEGPGGLLAQGLAGPKGSQERIVSALMSGFFEVLPEFKPLPDTARQARYMTSLAMPLWGSKFRKSLSPETIKAAEDALRIACTVPDLARQLTSGHLPIKVELPKVEQGATAGPTK